MKCYHLILIKMIKYVATICQILRLKCTKIDFCRGFAQDPVEGAYSAPQTLWLDLRGLLLLGGRGGDGGKEGEERGEEREGRETLVPHWEIYKMATLIAASLPNFGTVYHPQFES